MGRGPTVAGQKEASAKAKSKIYGMYSKLIAIAAEKGGDMSINTDLADIVSTAKRAGVTADVIDRAIHRGTGQEKEGAKVEEIYYEGYAAGGVAVIVRALTDNRNRTAPSMRHIFSAYGGNLGETGSVSSFAFDYRGIIQIEKPTDIDAFELALLDTSALDYTISDTYIQIVTDRSEFIAVRSALQGAGYTITSSQIGYIPRSYIEVTDPDIAIKIYKILEELDADEDVECVYTTADIADALWEECRAKVVASRFRT